MWVRKVFTWLALMFAIIPAMAQQDFYNQNIRGKVVDKVSQSPLPGATVIIPDSDPLIGVSTDIDGNFRIEKITVGRINLQVSFIGYETVTLNNLLLTSGKELIVKVELEESYITADEVVITAKSEKEQPLNKMATVSARSFSVEETNKYAGSLGDPSRMAANFAGVAIIDDSRNDIIIRGNSPLGLL